MVCCSRKNLTRIISSPFSSAVPVANAAVALTANAFSHALSYLPTFFHSPTPQPMLAPTSLPFSHFVASLMKHRAPCPVLEEDDDEIVKMDVDNVYEDLEDFDEYTFSLPPSEEDPLVILFSRLQMANGAEVAMADPPRPSAPALTAPPISPPIISLVPLPSLKPTAPCSILPFPLVVPATEPMSMSQPMPWLGSTSPMVALPFPFTAAAVPQPSTPSASPLPVLPFSLGLPVFQSLHWSMPAPTLPEAPHAASYNEPDALVPSSSPPEPLGWSVSDTTLVEEAVSEPIKTKPSSPVDRSTYAGGHRVLYTALPEVLVYAKPTASEITAEKLKLEIQHFREAEAERERLRRLKAYSKRVSYGLKRRVDPQEVVQRVVEEMEAERERRRVVERRKRDEKERMRKLKRKRVEEDGEEEEERRPATRRRC